MTSIHRPLGLLLNKTIKSPFLKNQIYIIYYNFIQKNQGIAN